MRNAWDEMLPERAFVKRVGPGNRPITLEGGPSGGQPTSVSQTTIPEYAEPYMTDILGKAAALSDVEKTPYQVYGGERIAGPSVAQQEARLNAQNLQMPGGFDAGASLAQTAGLQALTGSQYDPTSTAVSAPQLTQYGMQGAQTAYNPTLAAPEFSSEEVVKYGSPFMQEVVERQKLAAIDDAKRTQLSTNLAAARQGTYGGARQALLQGEREAALGGQLGDIQAQGLQSAYESAQAQFERDRAAKLGVQALGADIGLKTSLANLNNEQQARVQNLAASLQTQGLGANQALQAALANQANQQFGSELGLKGTQAATQSAAVLGDLAGRQGQTQLANIQFQNQMAAQRQAEQQARLDMAYGDFQAQQADPYTRLGFMSDLLRGSSNLAQTGGRAIYQQPPSAISQIGGLGLSGLALQKLMSGM